MLRRSSLLAPGVGPDHGRYVGVIPAAAKFAAPVGSNSAGDCHGAVADQDNHRHADDAEEGLGVTLSPGNRSSLARLGGTVLWGQGL